jgi:hypothetical protein
MNKPTISLTVLVVAVALASGCKKPPSASISLLLTSSPASGRTKPGPTLVQDSGGAFVAVGTDTLFLERVELVLRDVEIAPSDAGDCEGSAEEDEAPCPELAKGPVRLTVPLGPVADSSLTARLVPGTYSLLQFQIQTPAAGSPDSGQASVSVTGVLSQQGVRRPVSYALAFNEREQLEVDPPLAITAGGAPARLTLSVDIASWFLNAQRTALIDPATAAAGQPNEHRVWDNIRMSLGAEAAVAP